MAPTLTFFCELETPTLQDLFTPDLLTDLQALQAGLSLAILDLSEERAKVIQMLNQANISVTAWLLLPPEQGYWFNAQNASQVGMTYADFSTWTKKHQLVWAGVGLNFEPPLNEVKLWQQTPHLYLKHALKRMFNHAPIAQATAQYKGLVAQIQRDGYMVESYIHPLILDERQAGAKTLRNITQVVDVSSNKEVVMLYSSRLLAKSPAILCSYAPEAQAIAVGVTGGGIKQAGPSHLLSWEDLGRDLRLAQAWSEQIYIFSLEGCVSRDFIPKLKTFNWAKPVTPPISQINQVAFIRQKIQKLLWVSSYPGLIVGLGLSLLGLFGSLRFMLKSVLARRKK